MVPLAEVVILSSASADEDREGGVPPPGEVAQKASPQSGTGVVAL